MGDPFDLVTVHVAGYRGKGLSLTVDGRYQLPVPSDGIWKISLTEAVTSVDLRVVQQPTQPDQECDVIALDADIFTVGCHEQTWNVAATIQGLEGKGLTLGLFDDSGQDAQGAARSTLAVAEDGPISFPRSLVDATNYEVRVLTQPTEPRQTCIVDNANGFADSADVGNVSVKCSTKTYVFTSVITGLVGTGLSIGTSVGTFPIDKPGTTTYSDHPYPDGFRYDIQIANQPHDPDQVCYIADGKGVIDGANVTYNIICDAAGNLRISEVGACPYSSSACWFEIFNTGNVAEQLAFYTVRTSAISSKVYTPSRKFALPTIQVPARSAVIVQGKAAGALADGEGVYHIADGETVPWWGTDGFVELLNPAGATASFVRFGNNTIEPTTGGTWGGGAAPALPIGAGAYGRSLQHFAKTTLLSTQADWRLLAFATYGGINDAFNDADSDNDGIPDTAEMPGGTFAGLNMYGMGARVGRRDVFIEVDRMAGDNPALLPRKEALDKVVEAFRFHDIAVHFDVGDLFAPGFDPDNYNLGGGNTVPYAQSISMGKKDGFANLYDIKAANMEARRRMIFYYLLFAWSQQENGSGGSSGVGELLGNDSIVTLGGFNLTTLDTVQRNLVVNYQAASVMHELGHNFGLRHGGGDQINRKPNYFSVMNYLYSPLGLPTIGAGEGDRYYYYTRCAVSSVTQLFNAPSGDITNFVIDYSNGVSANIDEGELQEVVGLGRLGGGAVDYNCNGKIDSRYARDLNNDGALDVLADNDDWSKLDFVFRRSAIGSENGPSLRALDAQHHDDVLTDDGSHALEEPCPGLRTE